MYEWFVGPTYPLLYKLSLDPSPTPSLILKYTHSFPKVFLSLALMLWLVGKWINSLVTLFSPQVQQLAHCPWGW